MLIKHLTLSIIWSSLHLIRKLYIKNLTSYCADNANVNYGKHNSVFKLFQENNKNVLKANCSNHILHNATKHASDGLDVDIDFDHLTNMWTVFSISKKKRRVKVILWFCWCPVVGACSSCAHSLFSLTSAVDRLIQNWLPIKSYFKSVNDCPKILKKHFSDEDSEKECIIEAYLNFFPTLVLYLFNLPKLLKLLILASCNAIV